jgi:branched-chain amino acid aminotransferase
MINLSIPLTHEGIKQAIYKTIKINKHFNAYIRVSISRGPGPIGLDPELCPKPTMVIITRALKGYSKKYYQKGVRVALVNVRRNLRDALNPQIKSLNFLNNILAKIEARQRQAYEAIMLNHRGYVAEGTITNIFFVKDNVLCTPSIDVGILDGITRRVILEIARELNIKTKEGRFRATDIYNAQEVFISNTTMEVMPVIEVDDIKIGRGIGNITKMLHLAYKKRVSEYISQRLTG